MCDRFGSHAVDAPREAWRLVALPAEAQRDYSSAVAEVLEPAARHAIEALRSRLEVKLAGSTIALNHLAYEADGLEGLIDELDLTELEPSLTPLARRARDAAGRWRAVLQELDVSTQIETDRAIALLGTARARTPRWVVTMVAAGIEQGYGARLLSLPCVVTVSGERFTPKEAKERLVVRRPVEGGLAERLQLAIQIDPEFLRPTTAATTVREWLRATITGDVNCEFEHAVDQPPIPSTVSNDALAVGGRFEVGVNVPRQPSAERRWEAGVDTARLTMARNRDTDCRCAPGRFGFGARALRWYGEGSEVLRPAPTISSV
jgi:hypothetical protein